MELLGYCNIIFFANFPLGGGARRIYRIQGYMLLNIFEAGSFLKSPRKIHFSADRYSSDIYPMNTATN